MVEIEVFERAGDRDPLTNKPRFRANIAGNPRCWGAGATKSEAVYSLLTAFPELFDVKITEAPKRDS